MKPPIWAGDIKVAISLKCGRLETIFCRHKTKRFTFWNNLRN